MLEGDPVARGPFGVDGLLGDEAMAPAVYMLVVSVHLAFSHSVALKVVVGDNTVIVAAAVIFVNHPIDTDALTHVYGQDHSEETSAEKRPSLHSIFPRCVFKHFVAMLNLLFGDGVHPHARVLPGNLPQGVEHAPLAVLPHVALGTPEHVRGARGETVTTPQQVGDARVRHHPHGGAAAHVLLVAPRGGRVHAEHARGAVDLLPGARVQHLTRAGHQGALAAAHVQRLIQPVRIDPGVPSEANVWHEVRDIS